MDISREYQTLSPDHYLELNIEALSPASNPLTNNFTFTCWIYISDASIDYEYLFSINNGLNRYLAFTIAKPGRFEVYYRGTNTLVSAGRQIIRFNFDIDDVIQRETWYFVSVTMSFPNIYVTINSRQLNLRRVVYFDVNNVRIKVDVNPVMPFPFAGFDPTLVVSNLFNFNAIC